MRILNRKEFLEQPGGTVYSKYHEGGCVFELCIKTSRPGELENDWYYIDLIGCPDHPNVFDYIDNSIHNNVSLDKEFELDYETVHRDGMFDKDDYFMVFGRKDQNKLINKILRIARYE